MAVQSKNRSAKIIPVLGDQLSMSLTCLKEANRENDIILMCEVYREASYVKHHKKKIAFIFSAMRHHAQALREDGWQVDYVQYNAAGNSGTFTGELKRALERHNINQVASTKGSEHRVVTEQLLWADTLNINVKLYDDDRFICSRSEFSTWAKDRKSLRMEYFYRKMRLKTGLLMQGDDPVGGQWNFDKENRKPAKPDLLMPKPMRVKPDEITNTVLDLVGSEFDDHFGTLEPFHLAVTAKDAQSALDHFITYALPSFGDYQDAMLSGEPFLYHSLLSPYINVGLLDPLEVCQRAEAAYLSGDAPINAVEGFIRQIIGWREYINGIYWFHDPEKNGSYTAQNFLEASRPLPDYFWSAQTDMACVKAVVSQTRDEAYAHHIQRLMVTGLFAMLIGVDPKAIHEWYLAVYVDAFKWVEAPNVIGMSQYADGGHLGSKPYAASGAYINRMSDYCSGCTYNVRQKTESESCPFNSLYWDFLIRNKDKLGKNPRLAQMYRNWDRLNQETKTAYRQRARHILASVETL